MTTIQCSNCLGNIKFEDGSASCDNCGIIVNLSTHTATLSKDAPIWVQESYKVLCEIARTKPMFVFGKNQLFTKNFKANDCSIYSSPEYIDDETPSFFIAYNGIVSRFLKILLFNYINVGDNIEKVLTTITPESLLSIWLLNSHNPSRSELTYDSVKTLTAIMAPTWIDCANAVFDDLPRDISRWTESEMLYAYMICNKLPLLEGIAYKDALSVLKKFILEKSKFVYEKNEKLSWTEDDMKYLDECSIMCHSNPELYTNNWGSLGYDNIAWLFGTNSIARPIMFKDEIEYEHAQKASDGLYRLWTRYGTPNSRAIKTLRGLSNDTGVKAAYITYWERMRNRLR